MVTKASDHVLDMITDPVAGIVMDSLGSGIDVNGAPLTNLASPVSPLDAVTKQYADGLTGGLAPGMLMSYVGTAGSIPTGWLLCDGSTIGDTGVGATYEGTQYQNLFEIVKFAAPNTGLEVWGSNFVILPNMRGRIPVGLDPTVTTNPDPSANVLGNTDGHARHTLSTGEMPLHAHTGSTSIDGDHTHPGSSTGGTGNHSHGTVASATHNHSGTTAVSPTQNSPGSLPPTIQVSGELHVHNFTTGGPSGTTSITGGTHSHTISITNDGDHSHSLTINSTGNSDPHNNMQPYVVVNWIIKI